MGKEREREAEINKNYRTLAAAIVIQAVKDAAKWKAAQQLGAEKNCASYWALEKEGKKAMEFLCDKDAMALYVGMSTATLMTLVNEETARLVAKKASKAEKER